jgi:uncharacterized radical SAM superfamily Fe-S cluster-containing enzyme
MSDSNPIGRFLTGKNHAVERKMNILKETLSICPVCYTEKPATVHEKDDGIYLKKACTEHGAWDTMVADNKEFYKFTMQKTFAHRNPPHISLGIPLTHACNLKCFFCYANDRSMAKDIPPDKVKEVIRTFRGDFVFFTGGEPTLSPHLPEYLKTSVEAKKPHSLLTNCVRLEDKKYLKSLMDAGLQEVIVPMYGFTDDIFERMTGMKLLKNRMKAMKNIKKAGLPICLSYTMHRGINDLEIPELIEFGLANADNIYQMRMRSVSPAGALTDEKPLFISEYVALIARALEVQPQDIFEHFYKTGPYMQYTFAELYKAPKLPCHFEINIVKFLREQAAKGNKRCAKLLKLLPRRNANHPDIRRQPEFLFIAIFDWATVYSADLMDFRNYVLGYYTYNRGEMPFLEATLLSGRTVEM